MSNSLEIKKHWNKIGNKYQNFWHSKAQKKMSEWETDFIKELISKKQPINILDLGIGNGRIVEAITEKSNDNASIYGIDISSEMVDYCKVKFSGNKKIKKLSILENNENLDIYHKKFDLITSIRVVKYNENWEQILIQLFGLLNKDGIILFSMTNKCAITRFLKTNITYIRVCPSYVKKMAYKNNMKIIKIRGFSRIPDYFYNINNNFISGLIIFGEKILEVIFGKYFLCREVFYILKKNNQE